MGRECTYNRPERKRGPTQGVRQKLEGQVEILESILGFIISYFPDIPSKALSQLDLQQPTQNKLGKSPASPSGESPGNDEKSSHFPPGNIFPNMSKAQSAEVWRRSQFARMLAPSLGMLLGDEDGEEDGGGGPRQFKSEVGAGDQGIFRRDGGQGPPVEPFNGRNRHQSYTSPSASSPTSSFHASSGPAYGFSSSPNSAGPSRQPMGPPSQPHSRPPHQPPNSVHSPGSLSAQHSLKSQTSTRHQASFGQQGERRRLPEDSTADMLLSALAFPAELEDEMDNLLDKYFTHFHPIYPFIDKAALLKWSSSSSSSGKNRLSWSPGTNRAESQSRSALALAICSLSCCGYGALSGTGEELADGRPSAAQVSERARMMALSDECHSRARAFFFYANSGSVMETGPSHTSPGGRADGPGDLEAVQTLILLSVVDFVCHRVTRAWVGLGMAIRLAQDLGVCQESRPKPAHLARGETPGSSTGDTTPRGNGDAPPTPSASSAGASDVLMPDAQPSVPGGRARSSSSGTQDQSQTPAQPFGKEQIEQARRLTWWVIFILDTFYSISLGRAPALRRSEFDVQLPDPTHSTDEWSFCQAKIPKSEAFPQGASKTVKARMISTLNAQIGLAEVLSELSGLYASAKSEDFAGGRNAKLITHQIEHINTTMAKLHAWRSALPPHLAGVLLGAEDPRSLASPLAPSGPQPCQVWHLALQYHFAFAMAERVASSVNQRSAALSEGGTDGELNRRPAWNIDSLWDARAPPEAAGALRRRTSGRGDFYKVTIASPTSEAALPRLLIRYVSTFGSNNVPPLFPYFTLAAAHSIPSSGSSNIQESWDALTRAASAAAVWTNSMAQVSRLLPYFSRLVSMTAGWPTGQPHHTSGEVTSGWRNLEPSVFSSQTSPVRLPQRDAPGQPLPANGHGGGQRSFDGTVMDLGFDSFAPIGDELDSEAQALAYALGLPAASSTSGPSSNGPRQMMMARDTGSFGANMTNWGSPIGGPGGSDGRVGLPNPGLLPNPALDEMANMADISKFFDLEVPPNSNTVLYQLGLQHEQTGKRPSSSHSHTIPGTEHGRTPGYSGGGEGNIQDQGFNRTRTQTNQSSSGLAAASSAGQIDGLNSNHNLGDDGQASGMVKDGRGQMGQNYDGQRQVYMSINAPSSVSVRSGQASPPGIHGDSGGGGGMMTGHAPHQPMQQLVHPHHPQHHQHHHHHSYSQPQQYYGASGGGSRNQGLVPRGADPNAALGGLDLELEIGDLLDKWVHRGGNEML
ncbi:hypothetical protein IE53DRAFT_369393 [Violaceomyces palustris]|uniref:Uncharacterized protein n=1 Tax=Violaceomyces palustris TaxID=1673888 RepID=A0ACD0NVN9_9BASI|nr:hypothetical protein IE53DRAFT_369393 [Violaceomyces palustris]